MSISSPLDDGVLQLRSMTAMESLGNLFQFDLELSSADPDISLDRLLGEPMTVGVTKPDGSRRYFNGLVSNFSFQGLDEGHAEYSVTLQPWLWFLTRTANCRVFQEMTVPDILKNVFADNNFSDLESSSLGDQYREWDYCVQYRESDFNFVSRLMEQEGIYYYFTHEENKHTLVLADSYSAHEKNDGYDDVPYFPPDRMVMRERDHISSWSLSSSVQPGAFAHTDFNYLHPGANMLANSAIPHDHAHAEMRILDYPGEYVAADQGNSYARIRMEEIAARYETASGGGDAAGLNAGCLFRLTDYPRRDQNREYLIVSMSHSVESNVPGAGGEVGETYSCCFTAMNSRTPYRSPRKTPKPAVQGPQTAIVVDREDPEDLNRVKILFHWNADGEDTGQSCWVRVAQIWAGGDWGAYALPQIDDEVIVEFLEGDPDRPIVTGSVYNADNRPPYEGAELRTRTGFKTIQQNELRFDDKEGEEEVYIRAQLDMKTEIGNDASVDVRNDRTVEIANDDTLNVGNELTIEATSKITLKVGGTTIEMTATDIKIDGVNVDIKGSAGATLKADAQVEINGSAMTTVKGGLVKIN